MRLDGTDCFDIFRRMGGVEEKLWSNRELKGAQLSTLHRFQVETLDFSQV